MAILLGTRQDFVEAFSAAAAPPPVTSDDSWSRRNVQKNDSLSRRRGASSILIRLNAEEAKKETTTMPKASSSTSSNSIGMQKRLAQLRPVFLSHERDFFRQGARLESMDSYVLVSTLTASMSFGCLVGFKPQTVAVAHVAVPLFKLATMTKNNKAMLECIYRTLCVSIQIASGMSALCGLYATVIFSLTILYGKSALGAERDREYDKFLRRTVRSRVNGARCFTLSLALFALTTVLVLIEKTFLCGSSLPVSLVAFTILYRLYKDWKELSRGRDQIFRDQT
jgi:hypothetical protein